jgi:hypothetical protein
VAGTPPSQASAGQLNISTEERFNRRFSALSNGTRAGFHLSWRRHLPTVCAKRSVLYLMAATRYE